MLEMQLVGIAFRIQELDGAVFAQPAASSAANVARRISYGAGNSVYGADDDDVIAIGETRQYQQHVGGNGGFDYRNTNMYAGDFGGANVQSSSAFSGLTSATNGWEATTDDIAVYSSAYSYNSGGHNFSSGGPNYSDNVVDITNDHDKLCNCGLLSARRTSNQPQSLNRVFYCCSHSRDSPENCGFYEWEDGLPGGNNYGLDGAIIDDAPIITGQYVKDHKRELKNRFGHNGYREGQQKCVEAAMKGQDVFCLMPTGGGKSIVYQVIFS
jgi:hypothetical protein